MMIFSQGKRELVNREKVAVFTIENTDHGKFEVVANYETANRTKIGKYKTLKRAIEILQVIAQSHTRDTVPNIVYEMPKE